MARTVMKIPPSLCLKCRGASMLCGLSYCPIQVKLSVKSKSDQFRGKSFSGSSPPGIFVGRYGYPNIKMYPSAPPEHGDTGRYEEPSEWIGLPMEQFLSMRLSMARGSVSVKVSDAVSPERLFQEIQAMALSGKSVDIEMDFEKPLAGGDALLDEHVPPMGPSAPLKKINIGNSAPKRSVDRVHSDTDMKAMDAMEYLYRSGIDVYEISKIMSVGAIGNGNARKAVPTRWSITAADKNVSDILVEKVKDFPQIDKYYAYVRKTPGNLFMGILVPWVWIYEWGEAWFPGSTWNQWSHEPYVEIDNEDYYGRKTYPGIGGCYYSTRLAVAEKYMEMKRGGGAITWREIYPGFNLPVGVWYVRENMRELFRIKPEIFDTLDDAIKYISQFMVVNPDKWKENSKVIPSVKYDNLYRFM